LLRILHPGIQNIGTFSFDLDVVKGNHAASEIKALFDCKPKIDSWATESRVLKDEKMRGSIELRDVYFQV
jgi:ATP-binding cassette subfamily B (MDR/TAP) protein 1